MKLETGSMMIQTKEGLKFFIAYSFNPVSLKLKSYFTSPRWPKNKAIQDKMERVVKAYDKSK